MNTYTETHLLTIAAYKINCFIECENMQEESHTGRAISIKKTLVLQADFLIYDKNLNYVGHNMTYFVIRPQHC